MNKKNFISGLIVGASIVVILIGLFIYYLPQLYLQAENSNFEKIRKKSELNCATMPLHCLLESADTEGINKYIESGRNLELKDNWGQSAMFWALRKGKDDFIPILLDAGSDSNTKDETGMTILYQALLWEKYNVAELLIVHGADVDLLSDNKYPETILHRCVMRNKLECVKFLLAHGANKHIQDTFGYTVFDRVRTHDHISSEIGEVLKR